MVALKRWNTDVVLRLLLGRYNWQFLFNLCICQTFPIFQYLTFKRMSQASFSFLKPTQFKPKLNLNGLDKNKQKLDYVSLDQCCKTFAYLVRYFCQIDTTNWLKIYGSWWTGK